MKSLYIVLPSVYELRFVMKNIVLLLIIISSSLENTYAQWKQTNGPYTGKITCIANLGTFIFIGTYGAGVFRSSDNGKSWIPVNNGINSRTVHSFHIQDSSIFVGTGEGGIFLSKDYGSFWEDLSFQASADIYTIIKADSILFAGTGSGVIYSIDNGTIWQLSDGLILKQVHSLLYDGTNLYAGTNRGFFASQDLGLNWEERNIGLDSITIYSLLQLDSTIYAGTKNGIYKSSNLGKNWGLVDIGVDSISIISLFRNDSMIFAGTNGSGILKSADEGLSWEFANIGISNKFVHFLTSFGNKIYAGTSGVGIYMSEDKGSNWIEIPTGIIFSGILSLEANGSNIYAGTWYGVFKSMDRGANWIDISSAELSNFYIWSLATIDSFVYAGTQKGLFFSKDYGNTWESIKVGTKTHFIYSLAIQGNKIFAGTDEGLFLSEIGSDSLFDISDSTISQNIILSIAANDSIVMVGTYLGGAYKSSNNSIKWTWQDVGLAPIGTEAIMIYGSKIYATSIVYGVSISNDLGKTWTYINDGLRSPFIKTFIAYGDNVFLGAFNSNDPGRPIDPGGVFHTKINQNYWIEKNSGLQNLYVTKLAISENNIFAGTPGSGVWVRSLSEITGMDNNFELVKAKIKIYPNPADGKIISILLDDDVTSSLEIFSILGERVYNSKIKSAVTKIDISSLAKGMYLVRISRKDNNYIEKVIVQ